MPKQEIYQTDLKNVTQNTYSFLNYFRKFISLVDCLKNVLQTNILTNTENKQLMERQSANFVGMVRNYRKFVLEVMIYQKESLL